MTQIMSRTTTLLDGRKNVKMTGRIYLRAIVPIGAFFSLSLICGNITYLYLGVAFIQMLKVGNIHTKVTRIEADRYVGDDASRSAVSGMGGWYRETRDGHLVQGFLHRDRCRHSFFWRDPVRLHRLHVPAGWHCL